MSVMKNIKIRTTKEIDVRERWQAIHTGTIFTFLQIMNLSSYWSVWVVSGSSVFVF